MSDKFETSSWFVPFRFPNLETRIFLLRYLDWSFKARLDANNEFPSRVLSASSFALLEGTWIKNIICHTNECMSPLWSTLSTSNCTCIRARSASLAFRSIRVTQTMFVILVSTVIRVSERVSDTMIFVVFEGHDYNSRVSRLKHHVRGLEQIHFVSRSKTTPRFR